MGEQAVLKNGLLELTSTEAFEAGE